MRVVVEIDDKVMEEALDARLDEDGFRLLVGKGDVKEVVMSPRLVQILRLAKDGIGRYIFEPRFIGVPDALGTIWKIPVKKAGLDPQEAAK